MDSQIRDLQRRCGRFGDGTQHQVLLSAFSRAGQTQPVRLAALCFDEEAARIAFGPGTIRYQGGLATVVNWVTRHSEEGPTHIVFPGGIGQMRETVCGVQFPAADSTGIAGLGTCDVCAASPRLNHHRPPNGFSSAWERMLTIEGGARAREIWVRIAIAVSRTALQAAAQHSCSPTGCVPPWRCFRSVAGNAELAKAALALGQSWAKNTSLDIGEEVRSLSARAGEALRDNWPHMPRDPWVLNPARMSTWRIPEATRSNIRSPGFGQMGDLQMLDPGILESAISSELVPWLLGIGDPLDLIESA